MLRTFAGRAVAVLTSRKGVSAAEYAILAVGIIVAVGAAVASFQGELTGIFADISDKITAAKSTATAAPAASGGT
jgi:Flp pilus assembly pilin Flp